MPELLHPGVYVREVSSGVRPIEGVSTSTAAFIGVADKGPIPGTKLPNDRMAEPVMVTSMTEYFRKFGGFRRDSFLTYAVRSFYENGGRRLYIVRVAPQRVENTNPPTKTFTAKVAEVIVDKLKVSAANHGLWGNNIWVDADVASDTSDLTNKFKLLVYYGETAADAVRNLVESFDNVDIRSDQASYVKTIVNRRSEYIAITNAKTDTLTAKPTKKLVLNPDKSIKTPPPRLIGGLDENGGSIDYIGEAAKDNKLTGTGLHALDGITDVNLIAIPGQGEAGIVTKSMAYCKFERPLQDCFFVGDVGSTDPQSARAIGATTSVAAVKDAKDFADAVRSSAGDYGAVYFPWVVASDPLGGGANPLILVPPSGFVTGIYARVDNSRGVFKAPAGTLDSGLAGALSVSTPVSDTDQDLLNPKGMNVIRTAPAGGGIVIWGTRTIGNDPEWRYIPVRRMAIFLRVSIYYGIQWAVFEPNDEPLWAALRLNIRAFMLTQFRAGAFQGGKPDDAFFVRCDHTTTTQQDIDNGVVNILVGFAPLKPAEFVVLKLSQKVNQPVA
jgi:uncharacterized protein